MTTSAKGADGFDNTAGSGSAPTADAEVYSIRLPARPKAVHAARSYVAETLEAWGVLQDIIELAQLLTSELVTNAIIHAQHKTGTFDLTIEPLDGCFLIDVADRSRNIPVVCSATNEDLGGRGLVLVEKLAEIWGYDFDEDGRKHVWFRLPTIIKAAPQLLNV